MMRNILPKLGLTAFIGSVIAVPLAHLSPNPVQAETIIQETIIHYPSGHPQEDNHTDQREDREVTVEIVARGNAWADIYIDNRRVFSPRGLQRSKQFKFKPGAYNIRVHGIELFDVWAEGYLQISHDVDVELIVISFAENGRVRVAGDPDAWIPNSARRP